MNVYVFPAYAKRSSTEAGRGQSGEGDEPLPTVLFCNEEQTGIPLTWVTEQTPSFE